MFKNLSLRIKLTFAFLLIAALLGGVSYYQVQSIKHLNKDFLDIIDNDFQRLDALDELKLSNAKLRDQTFEYQQEIFEGTAANAQKQKLAVSTLTKNLKANEQVYINLTRRDNPNIKQQQLKALVAANDLVIQSSDEVVAATGTNPDQHAPESLENKLANAEELLSQAIDNIITAEEKGVHQEDTDVDITVRKLLGTIAILAIAATVLAVALGLFVATWISRSLSRLRTGAERIAGGDFSHPIPVQSNDEIGQLATAFNVMAQKLGDSHQRLAMQGQRDEAILQNMGEGLVVVDGSSHVSLINRVAADFFDIEDISTVVGQSVEESMKQYHVTDLDDRSLRPEQLPLYKTLTTGIEASDTLAFHAKDGNKKLFSMKSSPMKLEEKIVGAVVVLRDVTKEKEVDRMKTEFISLASHQLRTPLSAIKWFSEMLVSGDAGQLQPDQMDFAKNISDSTERMIALVNALLNISRIESGRIMVDPKPTDLRELVSGIVNDLKAKTEEKQQTLVISVHDGLPKINLDPRLTGQVYLNLLTNAIKYTPKGGEVSVFISKKDDQIISQVTDNGYGIPKEQQARVFQKFFRAANAVKVETDGTGLGLYLIKAIVESSGGKIWFKSEEGKGSTFWFSIPLSGMHPKKGEVTLDG
jgi:signal transduction histidine kinase